MIELEIGCNLKELILTKGGFIFTLLIIGLILRGFKTFSKRIFKQIQKTIRKNLQNNISI